MGHAPNREETETQTPTEADTQGPHAQMEKCKLKQPEETMEQRQSTETCGLLSAKTHRLQMWQNNHASKAEATIRMRTGVGQHNVLKHRCKP